MKLSETIFQTLGFKKYILKRGINEVSDERLKEIGFKQYVKTEPIWAMQVNEPFTVDTLEGDDISGKPGDWLAVGNEGELYPIDGDIFNKTYEEL